MIYQQLSQVTRGKEPAFLQLTHIGYVKAGYMTCPDMEGLSPRRSPCLVYCSMAAILKFLTLPLSVSFQVKSDETMEQACEQRTQQAAKRMRAQVWQAGAVQNVLGP